MTFGRPRGTEFALACRPDPGAVCSDGRPWALGGQTEVGGPPTGAAQAPIVERIPKVALCTPSSPMAAYPPEVRLTGSSDSGLPEGLTPSLSACLQCSDQQTFPSIGHGDGLSIRRYERRSHRRPARAGSRQTR